MRIRIPVSVSKAQKPRKWIHVLDPNAARNLNMFEHKFWLQSILVMKYFHLSMGPPVSVGGFFLWEVVERWRSKDNYFCHSYSALGMWPQSDSVLSGNQDCVNQFRLSAVIYELTIWTWEANTLPLPSLHRNIHPKTPELSVKLSKPRSELIQRIFEVGFFKEAAYMALFSFCLKINSKDFCCLPSKLI